MDEHKMTTPSEATATVTEQDERPLTPDEEIAESLRTEMNRSLAMYYSNLGTIYGTKGMMDEAEAQFKKALEVFPEDVLALFNLGRVHSEKRQFVEAKNYYERLVEVNQED